MPGYIDLAEYQPQSSDSDKIKGQNGFFDLEFLQNQHIVKIFCLKIGVFPYEKHGRPRLWRYSIVSPYRHGIPPINPFQGLIGPWHHGMASRDENLISPKLKVKKSVLAFLFIWVRALRLIFSQVYITRHCLPF